MSHLRFIHVVLLELTTNQFIFDKIPNTTETFTKQYFFEFSMMENFPRKTQ